MTLTKSKNKIIKKKKDKKKERKEKKKKIKKILKSTIGRLKIM